MEIDPDEAAPLAVTPVEAATDEASDAVAAGAKVGIIGAGVAGLQMARALRARGILCTVFDKASALFF